MNGFKNIDESKTNGKKFSFNHLTPTEFEEFCLELLESFDLINVKWRKGTGYTSSPSDSGRDIECERIITDNIDGEVSKEKWFVECKHHLKGVPPTEIQGVLSWANAKRPNIVLIIASNFLSNPCKDYIEDYISKNNPPFKIKYWELKDLEKITLVKPSLLKKYRISESLDFVTIMHPIHLEYIRTNRINTLDYFFKIIDKLDAENRDEIFGFVYLFITNHVNYENFKRECYRIESKVPAINLANYIIDLNLKNLFSRGDITSMDIKEANMEFYLRLMRTEMKYEKDANKFKEKDEFLKEVEETNTLDALKKNYLLYTSFCEEVLSKLIAEPIFDKYFKCMTNGGTDT